MYPNGYNYPNVTGQYSAGAVATGAAAGMSFGFIFLIFIAIYVLMAIPLMKIAGKTGFEKKAWWAWVPILNVILSYNLGDYSGWWMICPIGNIVVYILAWMKISGKCEKPDWLGILMIISPLNIIIPFYLAFSSSGPTGGVVTPPTPPPTV